MADKVWSNRNYSVGVELWVRTEVVSLNVVHVGTGLKAVDLPQGFHVLHDVRIIRYLLLVALEVNYVDLVEPNQGREDSYIR